MNRIRRIVGLALDALQKIAALDDTGANEELNSTGSYSSFDEPGSVQIARKALKDIRETIVPTH